MGGKLALYICTQHNSPMLSPLCTIVHKNHCHISKEENIENELGKGKTFQFELPWIWNTHFECKTVASGYLEGFIF